MDGFQRMEGYQRADGNGRMETGGWKRTGRKRMDGRSKQISEEPLMRAPFMEDVVVLMLRVYSSDMT